MTFLHVQFTSIAKLSTDKCNNSILDEKIKDVIKSCGFVIKKWLHLKESSGNGNKPILSHKIIDVECWCENEKVSKFWMYSTLRRKWSNVNKYIFAVVGSHMIPWLTFIEKDAFSNEKWPLQQTNSITQLFLGTLAWPSLLISHFKFLDDMCISCEGSFFHDVKYMEFIIHDYKLKIRYSDIRNILVKDIGTEATVFLDLGCPPLVFSETFSMSKRHQIAWRRIVTFPCLAKHTLGCASIFAITFANSSLCWEIISRMYHRCGKMPIYCVNMTVTEEPLKKFPEIDHEHFGCLYLISGLLLRSYVMGYQCNDYRAFLQEMKRLAEIDSDVLEKVLADVLLEMDRGIIFNYNETIHQLFEWYRKNKYLSNYTQYFLPEKTRLVRRLTVTPTRTLFWPSSITFENRILRKFDPDYTLRVSFRDDNQMRLNHSTYIDDSVYQSAIEDITRKGIRLGSRYYEFLAWSNSQIRDHAVWFYAKDTKGYTADAIRSWMGDFSGIRNVSKFMARMGQCFSQSVDTIFVPNVRTEHDIKGGRNPVTSEPYCFSDGIGKISAIAAAEVCKKLGLSKVHSAYQIRYAGYKGVLCIDKNLVDVDIVFRDSMKKFDCPSSNKLEIVQVSVPISVQLNRPFIAILEHLGVSGSTFLRMQQNMLQELTDILLDDDKAAEFLNNSVPNNLINFKELRQSGIPLTIEQFFRSLLFYQHRRGIVRIKKKAQLSIDPSEGRNMLGVLDETGILKYGQVFVKYTVEICEGKRNGKTEILEGKVLVTKNPCLQPGDVRLLEAVDVPQLHGIVDCVVFPKCGHRPHPSEMGGSDLDGDEYAVIWKRELVSPIKENYPPMNFPSPKPRVLMHEIKKDDMIGCLVGYVKNDTVGTVGTAHLIMADKIGLDSKECFELARKFSLAVDFIKSGEPTSLSPTERPKSYPDYLEKGNRVETYKSKKILGKLYRMCNEFETVNEIVRCHYHDVEIDPDLVYPGWQKYADDAVRCRNNYNAVIQTVFRRYGIQHECEAISGAFVYLDNSNHERNERTDTEKILGCIMTNIWAKTKQEFLREFIHTSDNKTVLKSIRQDASYQKASAWYIVTYREKDAVYLSFPWVVSRYLALVKLTNTRKRPVLIKRPLFAKWDEALQTLDHLKIPDVSDFTIDELAWKYSFVAPAYTIEIALAVISHWAENKAVSRKPKNRLPLISYVSLEQLVEIFFHVAYLHGYVNKRGDCQIESREKPLSPSYLLIAFFKYCMSVELERNESPFDFQIPKNLTRCATHTYHNLAVTATLDALDLVANSEIRNGHLEIEMEPQRLHVTKETDLDLIKRCLLQWTGINDIHFRTENDKYTLVSATGTSLSVRMLKWILSEKIEWLIMAFNIGRLPEDFTL